ncbi:MAG: rhomboid family intramembrane serine protease [Coprococcus sp.]|uniref:rhomboid family intramembrane serine protease n=1 Tax=Coprococcus catus TaxID=116085 RepID=UPI001C01DB9C|nr:rhomboid family intramembrane serine protease [Coprococcus catus]MBT9772332.1 rhomboid family intramembrane serine protease [Coprococcus catus]
MQQYYRGNRRNGLWQMSPVNTIIIVINVVVFAVLTFLGDTTDVQFMHHHGANFWPSVIEEHEYYRLLTCTFIHFGISHLFNNMLVLAYIGDNLERALGKVKYLVLYLAAGIGSSAVSAVWSMFKDEYSVSGGASGAIFGVVGALLVIVIKNRGQLEDLSSRQLMFFAGFSIYHGVTSAGIDNMAHISGFLIGALLGGLLYRRKRYWKQNSKDTAATW